MKEFLVKNKSVIGIVLVIITVQITIGALVSKQNPITTTSSKDYDIGDTTARDEIFEAIENLNNYEGNYYTSVILQTGNGGATSFLEVNTEDGQSYTEVPLDSNGNMLGSSDNSTISGYMLTDWIVDDEHMYRVSQYTNSASNEESEESEETEEDAEYEEDTDTSKDAIEEDIVDDPNKVENDDIITEAELYPTSYAKYCINRRNMYLDNVKDSLYNFSKENDRTIDLGEGDETLHIYGCELKSDAVKNLLAVETYQLYNSIIKDYNDDTNIVNLCQYYLDDLDMDLTFSDAKIYFGVKNKTLKYMEFVVGGLGTRLYLSKAIIDINQPENLRKQPDFADAKDFVETEVKPNADYVATFDSIEDAMLALNTRGYSDVENNSLIDESKGEEISEEAQDSEE